MLRHCCEDSSYQMTSVQHVVLRVSIVLGLVAAVVAVLYFSPMPDYTFENCDRPCHDLDWPMICRVKLQIDAIDIPQNCNENNTCSKLRMLTTNGQIPGPAIQVCQNDILVVDVINKVPGHSLTLHWRGQPNQEAPFMDGVPLVTQCPIHSYTTFQYKFRASAPGTHFYHAHSDAPAARSLFGALIVRQPRKSEPHLRLYDIDDKQHIALISETAEKTPLINGQTSLQAAFSVLKNKRYRFRLAYPGGLCPMTISIDNHLMKVIALDGNSVIPYEAGAVTLNKGERLDFVLKTNQAPGRYLLKVRSECGGDALGLINYEGHEEAPIVQAAPKDGRGFDTALCQSEVGQVCLGDARALEKLPAELQTPSADKTMYLAINSRTATMNGGFSSRVFGINNLTFSYPASPLLTQLDQVSLNSVCDELNIPEKCHQFENMCECVHVEFIPLNTATELVLINQDQSDNEHVFHLHGYRFYPVGVRQFDDVPVVAEVKALDRQEALFKRNLNNPPLKDTVRVPKNGVVAVRFLADNPGFWMLRDEKSQGWTRGLDMVFQVGDASQMPSNPSNFPTCGNYIGPDFFLM